MLSSTGPSAEYHGDKLGVFEYLEQYNDSPAYRQKHSVPGTQPYYLYRTDSGNWRVDEELGGLSFNLQNRTRSDSVPTNNWLYYDYDSKGGWKSDPEMSVTTSHPSVCGVITISQHGEATAQPETGGKYRATGDWRAGRPVFSNGVRYLCVVPRGTRWCVRDSPDSGWQGGSD